MRIILESRVYKEPYDRGKEGGTTRMVMVQEEAGGGTVLISRPQAHLTLSSCYISEGACVGAIISAPAIWPLVSGNEELDGHLGGRRRDKRGIYLRGFFLAIGS